MTVTFSGTQQHPITVDLADLLSRVHACTDARDWAVGQESAAHAWNACERGDWLLWLVVRVGVERTLVATAAARCAKPALKHIPDTEDRPFLCIAAVLRWADDPTEANLDAVRRARDAAYTALDADDADDAAVGGVYRTVRAVSLKRSAQIVRDTIPFATVLEAAGRLVGPWPV